MGTRTRTDAEVETLVRLPGALDQADEVTGTNRAKDSEQRDGDSQNCHEPWHLKLAHDDPLIHCFIVLQFSDHSSEGEGASENRKSDNPPVERPGSWQDDIAGKLHQGWKAVVRSQPLGRFNTLVRQVAQNIAGGFYPVRRMTHSLVNSSTVWVS